MGKKPTALIYTMEWGEDRLDPKTGQPVPNTSTTFIVYPVKWEEDDDPIIYNGMVLEDLTGWAPDLDSDPIAEFNTEKEAKTFIDNHTPQ